MSKRWAASPQMWSTLIDGENAAHLANLITGAIGGGMLGLIGGLLIRSRG